MRTPLLSVNRRVRPPSVPRARTSRGANLRGAALMVGSMAAFTLNDAAMKYVTQTLPLPEAVLIRGAAVTLLLLLIAQRDGGVIWWPFLIFSALYVVWRKRSVAWALAIPMAVHALNNLIPALLLLRNG